MTRTTAGYFLAGILLIVPDVVASDKVEIDFHKPGFDRRLFRTELGYISNNNMNFSAQLGLERQWLTHQVPAGKPGRPPMRFECLMVLEGNFEITVDFTIFRLPRPRQTGTRRKEGDPSNLVEIAIAGRGGRASVSPPPSRERRKLFVPRGPCGRSRNLVGSADQGASEP